MFKKTHKYNELVDLYTNMAEHGFKRSDGRVVAPENVYSAVQAIGYRTAIKEVLGHFNCKTALDYGAGGGRWDEVEVPEGGTFQSFLELDMVNRFEPARGEVGKVRSDVVMCFDVLEHVFVADIPFVVKEIFRLAKQVIIVNVACYSAAALLPNGENAHITVRSPDWWLGVFETIGSLYPDVAYTLYTSVEFNQATYHGIRRVSNIIEGEGYTR